MNGLVNKVILDSSNKECYQCLSSTHSASPPDAINLLRNVLDSSVSAWNTLRSRENTCWTSPSWWFDIPSISCKLTNYIHSVITETNLVPSLQVVTIYIVTHKILPAPSRNWCCFHGYRCKNFHSSKLYTLHHILNINSLLHLEVKQVTFVLENANNHLLVCYSNSDRLLYYC